MIWCQTSDKPIFEPIMTEIREDIGPIQIKPCCYWTLAKLEKQKQKTKSNKTNKQTSGTDLNRTMILNDSRRPQLTQCWQVGEFENKGGQECSQFAWRIQFLWMIWQYEQHILYCMAAGHLSSHRFLHALDYPDNKVYGANMGPIWGRQVPGGPHVGPMNFAIWAGHDDWGTLCLTQINFNPNIDM